ncbi:MAG: glutamine--tRNA ligase/YqeY domain fusion protein [Chitinivibrionales bacterium]|nr:glutamine--tRNA ligase/YqeY domain fusion protein [Chitinivibrionales bacterium]MBD3355672.1 glutamine--tRNA ligase/YqeY domain fusion protein [Chitinivibrionales bacterium]
MTSNSAKANGNKTAPNFIREIIEKDLTTGVCTKVVTRFPPEPNGPLHIGHAMAVNIDYGMAREFNGEFHLRFDDTNPTKEEPEYIDAIKEDVKWLGANYGEHLYYASDYFDQMYDWAVELIKAGKAYVDSLSPEEIRRYRGTDLSDIKPGEKIETKPGTDSPYRNRSVAENLELFKRMRKGEFSEGECVLRAKIDMAHPNLNMRDPIMYRIVNAPHYRQGDNWAIYPSYDWAHGLEDTIEGVTHSLCSIEFENHRPLYDWFLDELAKITELPARPRQYEFSRYGIGYTLLSTRKLRLLVEKGLVRGWDDPRLPTVAGIRRRGVPPEAIRLFCERVGVGHGASTIDIAVLEFCIRDYLNKVAPRAMAVLRPLKVVITNYPEGEEEELEAVNNPEDESAGTRKVPFSKVLYLERDDFMENPPKKFFRLAPGREVRLRYGYFITCNEVIKDNEGRVVELRCTYDPATRGGNAPDGRKVKATLHWVSAAHAVDAEVRLYDRLFTKENPLATEQGKEWTDNLNPDSLTTLATCKIEPSLADFRAGDRCQFERQGYFCVDPDSTPAKPVFNRIVTLKDEWAKIRQQQKK